MVGQRIVGRGGEGVRDLEAKTGAKVILAIFYPPLK